MSSHTPNSVHRRGGDTRSPIMRPDRDPKVLQTPQTQQPPQRHIHPFSFPFFQQQPQQQEGQEGHRQGPQQSLQRNPPPISNPTTQLNPPSQQQQQHQQQQQQQQHNYHHHHQQHQQFGGPHDTKKSRKNKKRNQNFKKDTTPTLSTHPNSLLNAVCAINGLTFHRYCEAISSINTQTISRWTMTSLPPLIRLGEQATLGSQLGYVLR